MLRMNCNAHIIIAITAITIFMITKAIIIIIIIIIYMIIIIAHTITNAILQL